MLGLRDPVLAVQLVPIDKVVANSYNPNSVAPPEMELLKVSIEEDGYTQPSVTFEQNDINEVVDGFHRYRIAKENKKIREGLHSHLPVVIINQDRGDIADRMAATIRHNRARGKHNVESMADIVVELKRRNKTTAWIAKHLGMSEDEILRLTQITGLAELFKDREFSQAWETKEL